MTLPLRTAAVLAASALLGATMLAGCSSDGASTARQSTPPSATVTSTSPTVSPTATPSPSTTAVVERFPKSEAGAKAFTRHVFDVLNDAFRTADDTELRKVISKSCSRCVGWADAVADNSTKGWKLQGDFVVLEKLEMYYFGGKAASLGLSLESQRTPYHDSKGATVQHTESQKGTLVVEVKFSEGWKVTGTSLL